MKLRHEYPRGSNGYAGSYVFGKYLITREPATWKRIWRVWEGNTPIDGFPTLRDAVKAILEWEEMEKNEQVHD